MKPAPTTLQDFSRQVDSLLKKYGKFKKDSEKDLWELHLTVPGPTSTIVINNQPRVQKSPDRDILFKVEFVGEGSIDDEPLVQVLFEISSDYTILSSYEEAMEYDIELVEQLLRWLFFPQEQR